MRSSGVGIFLLLLISVLLSGCGNTMLVDDSEESTTNGDGTDSGSTSQQDTYENLGAGYDVFDNYADSSKVKAQILDLEKLVEDGIAESKTVEKYEATTVVGESIEEYAKSFNNTTKIEGSYNFFSASVEVNYGEDVYQKSEYQFATYQVLSQKKRVQVKGEYDSDDLEDYLSGKFAEDINDDSVNPEIIFQTYGTHCMRSIIVGGRLDYNVSVSKEYVSENTSIGVLAEASFRKAIGSFNAESETVTDEQMESFEQNMQKTLVVYGGSSEFGQNIINENNYENWINSLANNQSFCEFGDDGLIPVWDFCENENRKDELKQGFATWAKERQYTDDSKSGSMIIEFDTTGKWKNTAGDDEMDVDDGEYIDVEASISFSVASNILILTSTFYIKEDDGDTAFGGGNQKVDTEIKYEGPGTLKAVTCDTTYSLSDTYVGESNTDEQYDTFPESQWAELKPTDGSSGHISYKVDHDGDDGEYVGIYGRIEVPISYIEEE